jgi:hypothetical protein
VAKQHEDPSLTMMMTQPSERKKMMICINRKVIDETHCERQGWIVAHIFASSPPPCLRRRRGGLSEKKMLFTPTKNRPGKKKKREGAERESLEKGGRRKLHRRLW